MQEALQETARDRALPPPVQRDAGFLLARTGWQPKDLDDFISIPAGTFLYDEKQEEEIDAPFAIAKYPVTNLQYRRFIQAGGYDRREFWSEEGWAWRTGDYDSKAPEEYQDWLKRRPPENAANRFSGTIANGTIPWRRWWGSVGLKLRLIVTGFLQN